MTIKTYNPPRYSTLAACIFIVSVCLSTLFGLAVAALIHFFI